MAQVVSAALPAYSWGNSFAALKSANFRLYFIGQLISTTGTWMQTIAQGFLVFQLTQSELWLGIVACAAGAPMLFIAPFAGVIVDRIPRRRVMLYTQTIQMGLAFILAALVFTNAVQIWHIVMLALLLGCTNAFDAPARQALVSDLVGNERLASGIALNSIIINGSRVFGPTMAGLFLATLGPAWCFLINGVSFMVVLITLMVLRLNPMERRANTTGTFVQLREGLRYVRGHEAVFSLLLLAASGGFFCWSTLSLFPAFADVILKSPKNGYAVISAANGLGAVLAGLSMGYIGQRYGRGRVLAVVGPMIGGCVVLMSWTTTVPMAALASAGFGFCAVSFFVTINTAIQLAIPNAFRGRVLSLYTLLLMGLNPFGALLLGSLAERVGNPNALLTYGVILVLVCTGVIMRYPKMRQI